MAKISDIMDPVWRFRGRWTENISEIMDAACIQLELKARKKEEAVRELMQLLATAGKLEGDSERYISEVMEREKISSTGIGKGIAIPHDLSEGVSGIMMAVGRSVKGIPFDSVDGKPAHLIFLIIGAKGRNSEYLKILSKLSRHLGDRGFFDSMMKAKEACEIIDLFKEKETAMSEGSRPKKGSGGAAD